MYSKRKFFGRVLREGGWPTSRSNRKALMAWSNCEGTSAKYNPLATTQKMPGSTDFNSAGVQNYISPAQGAEATVITINNGNYPAIVRWLEKGQLTEGIRGNDNVRDNLNTWGSGGFCVASQLGGII